MIPSPPAASRHSASGMRASESNLSHVTIGYDVTPDGSRLLMVTPVERPGAQPTIVVLDWLEALKRRVPR